MTSLFKRSVVEVGQVEELPAVTKYVLSLQVLRRMPKFEAMTDSDVRDKLMYIINSRSNAFVKIKRLRIER